MWALSIKPWPHKYFHIHPRAVKRARWSLDKESQSRPDEISIVSTGPFTRSIKDHTDKTWQDCEDEKEIWLWVKRSQHLKLLRLQWMVFLKISKWTHETWMMFIYIHRPLTVLYVNNCLASVWWSSFLNETQWWHGGLEWPQVCVMMSEQVWAHVVR